MLKLPTAAFVVSNAEPVRVGLETATELAPLPVNVMFCALGPKVIWAACAPDAHRADSAMMVKSLVFTTISPKNVDTTFASKTCAVGNITRTSIHYERC